MATSQNCKINFLGSNGGYLMVDKNGELKLSTNYDEAYSESVKFLKERVDIDDHQQETVTFRSFHSDKKYITGHLIGHTVTVQPCSGDNGGCPGPQSHWVVEDYAELTDSEEPKACQVALYHPNSHLYFVILQNAQTQAMCLSTRDDVEKYGVFALEPISD